MKLKLALPVVCFSLIGGAYAQPFDGLTTQQREWQNTARFYDDWQRDIRNRGGGSSGGAVGMPDYAAKIARSQMDWAARAGERKVNRLREQEEARRERERQKLQDAESARLRVQLEELRRSLYKEYLARGGRGTKETPPHFYDNAQAFQWYLKQAEAGDAYGAFYAGRAYLAAGNEAEAARWLAKSDLSDPKAAALYGSLLARGGGKERDPERGRQLLQKAAIEDQSGYAAQLYSSLLRSANPGPEEIKNAIVQLGRAASLAEKPTVIESIDMTAPWDENMPAREQRRRAMRKDLKLLAITQPEAYIAAVEEVRRGKNHAAYGTMMGVVGEMERKEKLPFYLTLLNTVENRRTSFDSWTRLGAIEGLKRSGFPDASARTLLPDAINRTANSFIPLHDDDAEKLWKENGAILEKWSGGTDELAPRAARALVARGMGRWPKVSPRQSPRAVLDQIQALKIANPVEVISGEVLDGVFTANPLWTDKEKSLKWLEELIALDGTFKEVRGLYLNAPALQSDFYRTDDPIVLALREALDARQEFAPAQLDAAEGERNAAALVLYSDPQKAFNGLLSALKGGDALAGWQLLLMAEGKFLNILKQRQRLLDLTDARLQRDAQGNDERAATAALALHFLHKRDAVGLQWQRGWRTSQPSTRDWLQLAEDQGHPWALFHSAEGYDAASKARDKNNPEAQAIWKWLDRNYDALNKTELWERDAQLLQLFPPGRDIESLKAPLRAIESVRSDALRYADIISRLASARELVSAYEGKPAAFDREQAKVLYEASEELAQADQDTAELLPRHRADRLELLVQATLLGHESAPLTVAALLNKPGFPLAPQPSEAARWLEVGRSRLVKIAETGPRFDAMDAAYWLATEFKSGETFARDDAQAVKYFALAATLGHQKSASTLSGAYRYGNLGVAKNDAEQQKWEKLAESIAMGRYHIPAAALAGRPKDEVVP